MAVLVAPTVLLVQALSGIVTTSVAIAVVTAEVGLVIVLRLYLVAWAHRRWIDRAEAVGRGSRALVMATTEDETVGAAKAALLEMLPGDVRLSTSPPHGGIEPAATVSGSTPPSMTGELPIALPVGANHSNGSPATAAIPPRTRARLHGPHDTTD